ncbi:cytochrome c biogenesis CcdA family protein [Desulfosediminicola flagellatus]|uniref:cytochrome c biogenesis CcdA family protein n=1 Tax=Desulfosediminicola flagellatus TaxID=2569541 RepID=UPI0010AC3EA6|nr:cytochrome c biogenesis protein CcdA [Desulfosediminicola flagellatus]
MDIQVTVSQWISQLADLLPVGYAFGAGMVSAVNPCGFFMLPVYMTLYLGAEDSDFLEQTVLSRILKATWVAIVVTAGFGLLFGLVGAVVSAGGYYLVGIMPWFAVAVGVILVLLSIWMMMGKSVTMPIALKLVDMVGDLRQMNSWGFFIFGLAFGATSLGCTLPIFLAVVGSSVTAGNFFAGLLQFISYVLGMGLVMHSLTLGIAVVKKKFVLGTMRRVVPYIHKISALFLLTAGSYIVYYWLSSGLLFDS